MTTKIFQGLITDVGINKARDTQTVDGWFIAPYEFSISETVGEFTTKRTLADANETWVSGKFAAIEKKDNNKILLTISLVGDEDVVQRQIKEIYLKCKTPDGTEFLYSIVQPLIDMTFVPTVSQEMNFLITLTNTNKGDIYTIQYVDATKLNSYQLVTEKGQPSGYCPLGADGIVQDNYLPLRDNLPIGTMVPVYCSDNYIPVGYLPCNGGEYTYAEFKSVYEDYLLTGLLPTCTYNEYQNSINTTGSCAKFALDIANAKFKVPYIADGVTLAQANSSSALNTIKTPGYYAESGTAIKTASIRWFVIMVHGLINVSLSDWSAWVNQLNTNTSDIIALKEWDIGVPIIMVTNTLPTNYIRLEGASVLISDYPKLYAKYGTTYGQVDSTHFTLPNFNNRAIWGATSLGYLSAGLPNISGGFHGSRGNGTFAWGAFTQGDANHTDTGRRNPTSPNNIMNINFAASNSNAIYGKSSTVQPPAIKVRVITRYQ